MYIVLINHIQICYVLEIIHHYGTYKLQLSISHP